MRLLDDIVGKEIIDGNASVVGKVKDMEIDTSSYTLESIIVTKGGSNKSFFKTEKTEEEKIPFEAVTKIGDKILLKDDEIIDTLLM